MPIDSAKLRKKVEGIKDLPTLPTVVSEIVQMAGSMTATAAEVGDMISRDPSLTTKVLKLVNSAFYGFPKRISTINHAIVILGFSKVKNIALSASVFDISKGHGPKNFSIPKLWEHSLGTAIASRVVARTTNQPQPEECFVAGLIHDMGKIIYAEHLTPIFEKVLEHRDKNNCLLLKSEEEVVGVSHSTVGEWITETWKLPPQLSTAVKYHHSPNAARQNGEYVASVHVGDIISRALLIGSGGDDLIPCIDKATVKKLRLTSKNLKIIITETKQEVEKAKDFFDMIN